MIFQKLLLALTILITVSGCTPAVVLHPITPDDIFEMKAGQSYTSKKEGRFLSNFYYDQVLKAKVKK
jgi:uncharacterized protein YceK